VIGARRAGSAKSRKAGDRATRVISVWSPPDPDEPTSQLYRLMPPRRQRSQIREALDAAHGISSPADDDPIVVISPDLPWWRDLAARASPATRRVLVWAGGLFTAALAVVIGSLIYGWLPGH
jgi:hypothetical protein